MRNRNETSRISIDVPKEQHRVLKASAALRGKSLSQYILEAIEKYEEFEKTLSDIPEEEKWLYEPENAESLKKLKRGLAQDGKNGWDDIKKRLKL